MLPQAGDARRTRNAAHSFLRHAGLFVVVGRRGQDVVVGGLGKRLEQHGRGVPIGKQRRRTLSFIVVFLQLLRQRLECAEPPLLGRRRQRLQVVLMLMT